MASQPQQATGLDDPASRELNEDLDEHPDQNLLDDHPDKDKDNDDDDDFDECLPTKYINIPDFKIQTLLDAYGSPWAPQDDVDKLNSVEAIATNGLLGDLEYLDSNSEPDDQVSKHVG